MPIAKIALNIDNLNMALQHAYMTLLTNGKG